MIRNAFVAGVIALGIVSVSYYAATSLNAPSNTGSSSTLSQTSSSSLSYSWLTEQTSTSMTASSSSSYTASSIYSSATDSSVVTSSISAGPNPRIVQFASEDFVAGYCSCDNHNYTSIVLPNQTTFGDIIVLGVAEILGGAQIYNISDSQGISFTTLGTSTYYDSNNIAQNVSFYGAVSLSNTMNITIGFRLDLSSGNYGEGVTLLAMELAGSPGNIAFCHDDTLSAGGYGTADTCSIGNFSPSIVIQMMSENNGVPISLPTGYDKVVDNGVCCTTGYAFAQQRTSIGSLLNSSAYYQNVGVLIIGLSSWTNTSTTTTTSALPFLKVVSTFKVGNIPYLFAYDPDNKMIYLTELADNTVSVINDSSNTVIGTINVGVRPTGIAYDPVNKEIYVANNGPTSYSSPGTISVINATSNTPITNITIGVGPADVAFDPFNNHVYATNQFSNFISVIDGTTNTVLNNISMIGGQGEIVYNPFNQELYVGMYYNGQVDVINSSTNLVNAAINTGGGPHGMVFDSVNDEVYVVDQWSRTLWAINSSTNQIVSNITVGANSYNLGFDPLTNQIFVSSTYGDYYIYVVSGNSNTVVALVHAGNIPDGILFDPNNSYVYINSSNDSTVTVVCPTC